MVWQAYCDESSRNGHNVIAGYVASEEAWAAFSEEWQAVVRRFGRVDEAGHYFHMTEMPEPYSDETIERVVALYRVIENHASGGIVTNLLQADVDDVLENYLIVSPEGTTHEIARTGFFQKDSFSLMLHFMLDSFYLHQNDSRQIGAIVPTGENVDFIFDNRGDKAQRTRDWSVYVEKRPQFQSVLGAAPRFEDDRIFLPLQAADLLAWWAHEKVKTGRTFLWEQRSGTKIAYLTITKAAIIDMVQRMSVTQLGEGTIVARKTDVVA